MIINPFKGKKIIFGITGCISAYKSCLIIRRLIESGAEVKVLMTPSAQEFITPLTLSVLSKNPVITKIFPDKDSQQNTWHIDLALWGDLMIIAPASINTIAKITHGFADNALTTLVTALRCPLLIVPTADMDMYQNPLTQENISKLRSLGYYILEAEEGFLASGLSGKGRLPEVEKILQAAESILNGYKKDFEGKKVLVTAGPTYEDIDPVRFLGNRSSGKMGYELAKALFFRGAKVTLISGPTSEPSFQGINIIKVRSADEMDKKVQENIIDNDCLIMAAAVADYRPEKINDKKIKKEQNLDSIKLVKTNDILGSLTKAGKKVVGFALETDNEYDNALKKIRNKNLDLIVLNSLKDEKAGFEFDTNKITIINKDGLKKEFPLMSKFEAANKILDEVVNILR
ncbi:MAG TPA: bifunctional phosphopantothenoylcysteine decarboxylase/phosphopantothenate--cysteine ligase CoaBC [Ignavibacteriaceae bacterium]|nr:bifunctional phosphopantothenoylcysteine decarboxylase/phosphopantothenate--cysteine ligase CoaBC [Ignavibacteriaceae bacterium]